MRARVRAGVRLQVDVREVRVLVPMDVTSSDSAAAVLSIKSVRVAMEPYACLNYSHAAICKMAARAAHAQAASERRALLEQMFMVPIRVSLDHLQASAGVVEHEREHDAQAMPEMRNAGIREVTSCLVEPLSLTVDVKLSMIRADASLPLSFVSVKIPALHLRFEAEQLALLAHKTRRHQARHQLVAMGRGHARTAGGSAMPNRSLLIMARMALRAQTGRTPSGYTPRARSASRLSDASLMDVLAAASSSSWSPKQSSTAPDARVPSRDWLDSSVHAALQHEQRKPPSNAPAAAGEQASHERAATASPSGGAAPHEPPHLPLGADLALSDVRSFASSAGGGAQHAALGRSSLAAAAPGRIAGEGDASQAQPAAIQSANQASEPQPVLEWYCDMQASDLSSPSPAPAAAHTTLAGDTPAPMPGDGHQAQAAAPSTSDAAACPQPVQGGSAGQVRAEGLGEGGKHGQQGIEGASLPQRSKWAGRNVLSWWRAPAADADTAANGSGSIPDASRQEGAVSDKNTAQETEGRNSEGGVEASGAQADAPAGLVAATPDGGLASAEHGSGKDASRGGWRAWWRSVRTTAGSKTGATTSSSASAAAGAKPSSSGERSGSDACGEDTQGAGRAEGSKLARRPSADVACLAQGEAASQGTATAASTTGMLSTMSTMRAPRGSAHSLLASPPPQSQSHDVPAVQGALTVARQSLAAPAALVSSLGGGVSALAGVDPGRDGAMKELSTWERSIHSLNTLFQPKSEAERQEELEAEAAAKVLALCSGTRLAAYTTLSCKGKVWSETSWRERLDVCLEHQPLPGLVRATSQSSIVDGLIDPDALPRLRDRHKGTFLLDPSPCPQSHDTVPAPPALRPAPRLACAPSRHIRS